MNWPPREEWDVLVVGAGVAGSVAACLLARRGLAVLLVDKADWPRDKVCGGCINATALRALTRSCLVAPASLGVAYRAMRLAAGGHVARFALPPGRAVSRRRLDDALVRAATDSGARFLPATRATPIQEQDCRAERRVQLRQGKKNTVVRARLVLACDGLGGRFIGDRAQVAPDSRIGVGTVVDHPPSAYRPGAIHMACGEHGYAGFVRVEDNRLNIGAALDPAWAKRMGGPASAIAAILRSAGWPIFAELKTARWQGTPRLTRAHSRLGATRLLALGDAAGYVEPFTGEGMAWAIAGAEAIQPYALAGASHWHDGLADAWTARHHQLIRGRQRACTSVAALLRHPRVINNAVKLAAAAPIITAPLAAWLNRDFRRPSAEAAEP
jgi:flavin-dependent dehydrogenase